MASIARPVGGWIAIRVAFEKRVPRSYTTIIGNIMRLNYILTQAFLWTLIAVSGYACYSVIRVNNTKHVSSSHAVTRSLVRHYDPVRLTHSLDLPSAISFEATKWIEAKFFGSAGLRDTPSTYLHLLLLEKAICNHRHTNIGESNRYSDLFHTILTFEKAKRVFGTGAIYKTRFGLKLNEAGRTGYFATKQTIAASESHRDQCLAIFGQLGVVLDEEEVVLEDGSIERLDGLLAATISGFHLKQPELAFSTTALAIYLPPQKRWSNRFGETFSFDDVCDVLVQKNIKTESCGGMHLLLALAVLQNVDRQFEILSDEKRKCLLAFLGEFLKQSVASQLQNGAWEMHWHSPGNNPQESRGREEGQMLITAHMIEWMSLLPPELVAEIPVAKLALAKDWIWRRLKNSTDDEVDRFICPLSHGACAVLASE